MVHTGHVCFIPPHAFSTEGKNNSLVTENWDLKIKPVSKVQLHQTGDFYYYCDYHLLHLIAHLPYRGGENGSNGEGKMQSRCQTSAWLTIYRSSLCIKARPCHLTFPLSLILQTSQATRYWFFILLNIALPLIEFKPAYPRFKEAKPSPYNTARIFIRSKKKHSLLLLIQLWLPTWESSHGKWPQRQKWILS